MGGSLGVIFLVLMLLITQGNGQDFRQIIAPTPLREVFARQCDNNQCEPVQSVARQLLHTDQDLGVNYKSPYSFLFDPQFHEKLTEAVQVQQKGTINVSSRCLEDITRLFEDLLLRKSYTLKVVDAIGKLPSGVSEGNFLWMGSYDLCTNITEYKSNISQDIRFQGRHCLASLKGPLLGPVLGLFGVSIGICVPDTCSGTDLKPILDIGVELVLEHLNISSKLNNETVKASGVICAEPAVWTKGDTAATVVTGILVLLCLCGSLYDIITRIVSSWRKSHTGTKLLFPVTSSDSIDIVNNDTDNLVSDDTRSPQTQAANDGAVSPCNTTAIKGFFHQFLMSFSAVTNTEKLLNTNMREGQLGAINGIRVLSMWWVILGHTYAFIATGGLLLDNLTVLESVTKRFTFQVILNGTYSVDSFFYLSGLLMAYLLLRELKKSDGKTNWALLYFHRYWRLTPVYMYVLLLYSTLWLHMAEGPFMRTVDGGSVQCQKYWWTNLLYINNFVPSQLGKECMGWAWYLANDMQFFIISPVIIYLLYRYCYIGYSLVAVLMVTCLTVTGIKARLGHVGVTFLAANDAFNDIYIYPWHRISPYLVGITTGYLVHLWENNGRFKIYKICVVVGWCLAIAINMSVLYGVYGPNSTGIPWNADVTALYNATSRFAWSLGLAWTTYACITGYGGPVNAFLSWNVWAPLGRLTYCAYLVHPIIIFNYYVSRRTLIHLNDYNMIYIYIGHLVISYLVAFVVSVGVEAPMMGLEKIIFKRKKD